MRQAQNVDTHALKRHGPSPKYFLYLLQFCASAMHLESESEKKSEKRWFTHSYKYPDTTNTFSLFLDEFLQRELWPIYCNLTCCRARVTVDIPVKHFNSGPKLVPIFGQMTCCTAVMELEEGIIGWLDKVGVHAVSWVCGCCRWLFFAVPVGGEVHLWDRR